MGMLKEGVRLDRVRGGRQKYRRNPTTTPYPMQIFQSNSSITPTSLEDIKILEVLTQCEPEALNIGTTNARNCCNVSDKENISDDKSDIFMEHRIDGDVQEMLSVLSDIYDKELVGVIGWAKQIPGNIRQINRLRIQLNFNGFLSIFFDAGFIELPLNDQMKLLQVTWAELLTIQLAYRSIPYTGKLMFAKDFWLDERAAKECGATELFNHVTLTWA